MITQAAAQEFLPGATNLTQQEYTRLPTFLMGFQEPVRMGGFNLHSGAFTPATHGINSYSILNGQEGLGLHTTHTGLSEAYGVLLPYCSFNCFKVSADPQDTLNTLSILFPVPRFL